MTQAFRLAVTMGANRNGRLGDSLSS